MLCQRESMRLRVTLLYHTPGSGCLGLQRSNRLGNAARHATVLTQVSASVNILHCQALASENSGQGHSDRRPRLGDHHHLCFDHIDLM